MPNAADIFKASLGTVGQTLAPGFSSLYTLGKGGVNSLSAPKQQYASSLQSSTSSPYFKPTNLALTPSAPAAPASSVGNPAATSPKQNFVNSQVNTGSTPTGSGVNPNYALQTPGGTAAAPPGNLSPQQAQYNSAFDQYYQSLLPTSEETAASKKLAADTLQSQRDEEKALNSGETLGFSAGEAQRVNRNNSFTTQADSNALNAFTNSRSAQSTANKARLDYLQSLQPDPSKRYTSVSPGASLYDTTAGKSVFTAPTTASQNPTGSSGGYVAGTNPIADGWVTAINNGQAKLSDVPTAYKSTVAEGLATSGKDDALKTNALTSAQQLLKSFQNSSGILGTGIGGARSAVGASSVLPVIPGTQSADFVANLDNLKSLLSLDNVKYLKGQGAVSDAERKLLADSATQLSRSQSEEQFQATLQKIIDGLSKFGALSGSSGSSGDGTDADYQAYLQAIGAQ